MWVSRGNLKSDGRRGRLSTCKEAFRLAGAVQETSASDMSGDRGADLLRRVAIWSIRSSGCFKMILRGRRSTRQFFAAGAVL